MWGRLVLLEIQYLAACKTLTRPIIVNIICYIILYNITRTFILFALTVDIKINHSEPSVSNYLHRQNGSNWLAQTTNIPRVYMLITNFYISYLQLLWFNCVTVTQNVNEVLRVFKCVVLRRKVFLSLRVFEFKKVVLLQ